MEFFGGCNTPIPTLYTFSFPSTLSPSISIPFIPSFLPYSILSISTYFPYLYLHIFHYYTLLHLTVPIYTYLYISIPRTHLYTPYISFSYKIQHILSHSQLHSSILNYKFTTTFQITLYSLT